MTYKKISRRTMLALTTISLLSAFCDESNGMTNKYSVLMIIAKDKFRDEELFIPKKMFKKHGIKVTVASTVTSTVTGMLKGKVKPDVLLRNIKVKDYDVIMFVGGTGAKVYYNDINAHRIARDAVKQDKILSAICIAPNILANAGVLQGKEATCWDSAILTRKGAKYQKRDVVTDGKIITANGPNAAREFAAAIIKILTVASSSNANKN